MDKTKAERRRIENEYMQGALPHHQFKDLIDDLNHRDHDAATARPTNEIQRLTLASKKIVGYRHHSKLCKELEKRQRSYLWTPKHMITFTPRVLPVVYGDGRALFAISTINQRPAFWIIRGCSTWASGLDFGADRDALDFAEFTDDILTDLESHFGNGRCGYSGNSLFFKYRERTQFCQCEECSDASFVARWPMVDGKGGCSWSRINWPKSFTTVPNPFARGSNLLADGGMKRKSDRSQALSGG